MAERTSASPFTRDTPIEKVRLAEDSWNTRPGKVALAYTLGQTLEKPRGAPSRTSISAPTTCCGGTTITSTWRVASPAPNTFTR